MAYVGERETRASHATGVAVLIGVTSASPKREIEMKRRETTRCVSAF
jgi:hypothetical protein